MSSEKARWLKYIDEAGYVQYEFTARLKDEDDRDGGDVGDHYHADAIARARRGDGDLCPLTQRDRSYPAAAAAFYADEPSSDEVVGQREV